MAALQEEPPYPKGPGAIQLPDMEEPIQCEGPPPPPPPPLPPPPFLGAGDGASQRAAPPRHPHAILSKQQSSLRVAWRNYDSTWCQAGSAAARLAEADCGVPQVLGEAAAARCVGAAPRAPRPARPPRTAAACCGAGGLHQSVASRCALEVAPGPTISRAWVEKNEERK